jgi:dihydrofolate reductase
MRRIVLYHLVSLDGVAEEPSNWLFSFDEVAQENLGRIIARQDTVLLGRTTFEEWAGFWPTSRIEPFASFINSAPKHVFSSHPLGLPWANSVLVDGPAIDHVRDLKAEDGDDIGVHGSIQLSQSLMRAGLVDRMHLVIAPTIVGGGRRLFDEGPVLQPLELVDLSHTPTGLVLATYGIVAR